jgi:aquaporin Z
MLVETKAAPAGSVWLRALSIHWPEYTIEAGCLGLFMVSACLFGTLLGHPGSPVVQRFQDPAFRRVLMGLAMGTTAIALIYSKFGKRSGAHMNPATTLTFYRLGKVSAADAAFYIAAQFAGGALGVVAASLFLGRWLSHPSVNYVVTQPGAYGVRWAFAAEALITFVLMSVILRVANTARLNRYTGLFAGLLVMLYISLEAPISGMSMNPARTLGSAIAAADWTAIWLYFTAPPLGMLLAAEMYLRQGPGRVLCAKLHHENQERCIFRCEY